jgi:hypothetical protein
MYALQGISQKANLDLKKAIELDSYRKNQESPGFCQADRAMAKHFGTINWPSNSSKNGRASK